MDKLKLVKILQIVLFLQDEMSENELKELEFNENEIEIGKKVFRNIGWFTSEKL